MESLHLPKDSKTKPGLEFNHEGHFNSPSLSQTVYWTDRVIKILLEPGLLHRSRCRLWLELRHILQRFAQRNFNKKSKSIHPSGLYQNPFQKSKNLHLKQATKTQMRRLFLSTASYMYSVCISSTPLFHFTELWCQNPKSKLVWEAEK